MKKYFNYYAVCWLVAFIVLNAIVFIMPNVATGVNMVLGSFFVGYILIDIAFLGQLLCSYIFFKEDRKEKVFLNLPIITISFSALIVSLIVGIICMLVPGFPFWLGVVICLLVFGFYVISIVKAKAAGQMVGEIDDKVKEQTVFIKSLTADSQSLIAYAKNDKTKAMCEKVYEAIRYSDPMSSDALSSVETEITLRFNDFSKMVKEENDEGLEKLCEDIIVLINDRNQKCKLFK